MKLFVLMAALLTISAPVFAAIGNGPVAAGEYELDKTLTFDSAVFEMLGESTFVLVDGTARTTFVWDASSDELRREILRYVQDYRDRNLRYTPPAEIRGYFRMRDFYEGGRKVGTDAEFMIESFKPAGTAG